LIILLQCIDITRKSTEGITYYHLLLEVFSSCYDSLLIRLLFGCYSLLGSE